MNVFHAGAVLLLGGTLLSNRGGPVHTDWPQWGGNDPGRNMYSAARNLPLVIDPGQLQPGADKIGSAATRNVKWVAKLGSQSYGNAVISRGKVFVGTNNAFPRDPRHEGDRGILMCFDEATGEFLCGHTRTCPPRTRQASSR